MKGEKTMEKEGLLKYCQELNPDITEYDIVETDGNRFDTPLGVFDVYTEEGRLKAIQEQIDYNVEDMGLRAFGDYKNITENYMTSDVKVELLDKIRDYQYGYLETVKDEESDQLSNCTREQEEMIEFLYNIGKIDFGLEDAIEWENENDDKYNKEITEFFDNYEDNRSEYADIFAEAIIPDYEENPIVYFVENFGHDTVTDMFRKQEIYLDTDSLAKNIVEKGNCGAELSRYDGEEIQSSFGNREIFIYKQDDETIPLMKDLVDDAVDKLNDWLPDNRQINADKLFELLDNELVDREQLTDMAETEILEIMSEIEKKFEIDMD